MPPPESTPEAGPGRLLIKAGIVLCFIAFVMGSLFFVVGAVTGQGIKPPQWLASLGAGSCVLFCLGLLVAFAGWARSVLADDPAPQPVRKRPVESDDDETSEAESEKAGQDKPDIPDKTPYDDSHRRRG